MYSGQALRACAESFYEHGAGDLQMPREAFIKRIGDIIPIHSLQARPYWHSELLREPWQSSNRLNTVDAIVQKR
jgi:hypothetical protein